MPILYWFKYLGNSDSISLDGTWYNNWEAAGFQAFPTGVHRFYDLFSWSGVTVFWAEYLINFLFVLIAPFTLIPIPMWDAWNTLDTTGWNWWMILLQPVALAQPLNIEMGDGWFFGY